MIRFDMTHSYKHFTQGGDSFYPGLSNLPCNWFQQTNPWNFSSGNGSGSGVMDTRLLVDKDDGEDSAGSNNGSDGEGSDDAQGGVGSAENMCVFWFYVLMVRCAIGAALI